MTEIEPGVFTDDSVRAPEIRAIMRKARTNSAAFFGADELRPRTIICAHRPCAETFSIRALGSAIGYHLVFIAPAGVNERTLTHEYAHIQLHAKMGIGDIIRPRYPHWFDEGLASHIAGDNRLARPRNPRTGDWVKVASNWHDWGELVQQRGAASTYGAAARLVMEIEERAGKSGLRALVDRVAEGADFDEEYRALIRP